MAKATPFRKEVRPGRYRTCVCGLRQRVPYCHHQCGGGEKADAKLDTSWHFDSLQWKLKAGA